MIFKSGIAKLFAFLLFLLLLLLNYSNSVTMSTVSLSTQPDMEVSIHRIEATDDVIAIADNFLAREECQMLIERLRAEGADVLGDKRANSRRSRSQVVLIDEAISGGLWARMGQARAQSEELEGMIGRVVMGEDDIIGTVDESDFPSLLGSSWRPHHLNTKTTIAMYEAGDFFGSHSDFRIITNPPFLSHYTLLIYLNDHTEFTGGEFELYEVPGKVCWTVKPRAGRAVIFRQESALHGGQRVESGEKYLLRSDIMYEREE